MILGILLCFRLFHFTEIEVPEAETSTCIAETLEMSTMIVELHPWRNWIAHRSSEPRVVGSNPTGCTG